MVDIGRVIDGLRKAAEELARYAPMNVNGRCQAYFDMAIHTLKEQESEWLEDSDPGQEYGTTWACRKCMHSIHRPYIWNPYDSGYKYCPHCGAKMKVKLE